MLILPILPDMPVEEAIGAIAVPVGVMPAIVMLSELMWSILMSEIRMIVRCVEVDSGVFD